MLPSATTRLAAAASAPQTLHLCRDGRVVPVARRVPLRDTGLERALRALLAGPTPCERATGVTSEIPAGTHLLGVDVEAGTATVDLSPDFAAGAGTRSLRRRVQQLVRTATELPGVARVRLRLGGVPVVTLGSSGLLVSGPLTRDAVDSATTA